MKKLLNKRWIALIVFLVFSTLIIHFNITTRNPESLWSSNEAFSEGTKEAFTLIMELELPIISRSITSYSEIYLNKIFYFIILKSDEIAPEEVCIENVLISRFGVDHGVNMISEISPICTEIIYNRPLFGTASFESIENLTTSYSIWFSSLDTFMYPFTQAHVPLYFQVNYELIRDNLEIKKDPDNPSMDIDFTDQNIWALNFGVDFKQVITSDPEGLFNPGKLTYIDILISSDTYYLILLSSLIIVATFLVGLLFTIESKSSFIEASAALFFGLFATKQLVTPESSNTRTIVDVIFFIFYMFILYAIIDHIFFKVASKDKSYPEKYAYLGSLSSNTFHKASCRYISKIPVRNRLFYYKKQDALNDGKIPCKTCQE